MNKIIGSLKHKTSWFYLNKLTTVWCKKWKLCYQTKEKIIVRDYTGGGGVVKKMIKDYLFEKCHGCNVSFLWFLLQTNLLVFLKYLKIGKDDKFDGRGRKFSDDLCSNFDVSIFSMRKHSRNVQNRKHEFWWHPLNFIHIDNNSPFLLNPFLVLHRNFYLVHSWITSLGSLKNDSTAMLTHNFKVPLSHKNLSA